MSDGLVIYALPVGGGTLAIASLPGRDGDYRGDMDVFHEWKPGIVLSMTTDEEMVAVGAPNLGSDIQAMASRWCHLPVQDFGAPDTEVNAKWPEVSRNVRQALAGGGRVIVHCRGGCGRSGMVALRLMVECGEDRFDALNRLRGLRDCAVETKGQLQWALSGEPVPDDTTPSPA
ncbi:protein-tyrosine phosphatase family protein [Alisedimentitalea sp. MJ-SS2]|uniref:phosphatase domain-containing protein n=1 Tax=Aliisedimentitalea sp. MJ-SS2 TaxID=3049795 RepID=UPI00291030B0|nr:protein-tyrosine phosphatase family protein [Alisedimentitalea sp. MJ-SS2]MDU8927652.1 protein-tyrosine phosphatase family protein [Alisedimentitalea sp. MJ-SS2]